MPDLTRPVVVLGSVERRKAVTVDVTAAFQQGPRIYTLALTSDSSNGATYYSRTRSIAEQRPQLLLSFGDP